MHVSVYMYGVVCVCVLCEVGSVYVCDECTLVFKYTHQWPSIPTPEQDIGDLPVALSAYNLETGCLTEPEAHSFS